MIGNRGSSDASTEGKAPKRRDGRGLGPLSSGHLTIIVVTLVVVVAFPFAAFAVTGNNVFVTDATSGTHAKVDSGGNVQTKVNGSSVELASGSGVNVAATGTRLAQLDVTRDERIRVTVANSCFSASAVRVTIAHVENPGTTGANLIDALDSITLQQCANVSRSYDVPGRTISLAANATNNATGSTVFFTVFGR